MKAGIIKMFAFVLVSITIFSSIIAYANELDRAYINEDYWNNNTKVTAVNFKIREYKINGVCKYYFDSTNNSIYFRFDFAGEIDKAQLKLNFNILNDNFAISSDGMCDYDGNENELYSVIYDFESVPMLGIKINNGNYVNSIRLKINYNGRNDIVIDKLLLDATPTTTVTTTKAKKAPQTTVNSNSATKANSTTKFAASGKCTTSVHPTAPTTTVSSYDDSREVVVTKDRAVYGIIGGVISAISLAFLTIFLVNRKNPLDN